MILIADDHPLFRAALRGAIVGHLTAGATAEFVEADSVAALLDVVERNPQADLLLLPYSALLVKVRHAARGGGRGR